VEEFTRRQRSRTETRRYDAPCEDFRIEHTEVAVHGDYPAAMNLSGLSRADLRALIRALHEARFPDDWNDQDVFSAPFVINLHTAAIMEDQARAVSALANANELSFKDRWNAERSRDGFDDFLNLRGRRELQVVKRRLQESEPLREWANDGSGENLRFLVSPFVIDDDLLAELLRFVGETNPT